MSISKRRQARRDLWNGVKNVDKVIVNTVKLTVVRVVNTVVNFVVGVVVGAIETVTFGITSKALDYNNAAYTAGRVVGNIVTGAVGGIAGLAGGTAVGGDGSVTSGGTLAVPAVAAGAAVATSGATVASRKLQSLLSMAKGSSNGSSSSLEPEEVTFDEKQGGKKWGKHKTDYPKLNSHQEYMDLATEIFNNLDSVTVVGDEIHYVKGNNLLRLTQSGEFIRLYPRA